MKISAFLLFLSLGTSSVPAQELPPEPQPRQPGGPPGGGRGPQPGMRRPMGPGMQQEGPWNQNLRRAVLTSDGKLESDGFFLQSGGVSHLVQDEKGRLIATFQWFPQGERELFDQVAFSTSADGGKAWTPPRKVAITGLPENMRRPYDPTLAVPGDGKLRLYFTSHENNDPRSSGIFSALSTDGGETFTFEPGKRFGVEGTQLQDCAVVKLKESWHMICPLQGGRGAMRATSADGLTFSAGDKIAPSRDRSWIGNLTTSGDKLRFWMGTQDGIVHMESADGITWSDPVKMAVKGMDPGVLTMDGGKTMLIYTGPGNMPGMGNAPRPGGQPPPGNPLPPPPPREPDVELKREPVPPGGGK